MTPLEQTKEKISLLEDALKSANPSMPTLLREIHNFLKAQPDIVTVLADEDINVIVTGLKRQTQIELVVNTKKSASKSKRVAAIDVDDL